MVGVGRVVGANRVVGWLGPGAFDFLASYSMSSVNVLSE